MQMHVSPFPTEEGSSSLLQVCVEGASVGCTRLQIYFLSDHHRESERENSTLNPLIGNCQQQEL